MTELRAILLAAGASSRLGEPKALAKIGGLSVCERLLGALTAIDDRQLPLVVTGRHDREIRAALAARSDAKVVHCSRWESGRTASLQEGIRAAGPRAAVMIAPADVPLVRPATIEQLARAFRGEGEANAGLWVSPTVADGDGRIRRGHPIILGPALAEGVLFLDPEEPLRSIRDGATRELLVPVDDSGILDDLDTQDDLRALRARMEPS